MKLNKRILMTIAIVSLIGIMSLIHGFTIEVEYREKNNMNILNKIKEIERINGGEILTPNQLSEFTVYGNSNIQAIFYKPISIYKANNYLGDIFSTVNANIVDNLPFKVGKTESYIVQVKVNNENKIKEQAHFIYLKDKSTSDNYGNEFVVISVYEMDQVRINNIFELLKKSDRDTFGNKVQILEKEGLVFINTKITNNEAFTYSYYQYNDIDKKLISNTTVANKIITQKNGLIYDVGYCLSNLTKEKEDKVFYSLIKFINSR